jgi:phosphoribosylamine--glycine ligase
MENKQNVLVIGSGGREHAIAWKLNQSPAVGKVYCAPGNGGIAEVAECVNPTDILAFCKEKNIALVVIGPEQPLVDGLSDKLRGVDIPVFGPSAKAAQLEASKGFTKEICRKYNIPTAAYETFTEPSPAKAYLQKQTFPLVVKADGLAAGKGVIIAENVQEAEQAVDALFFGGKIVIEEFLEGEEVSFFALSDGARAVAFGHAQDHKRAYDGDKGPNTGGMGTYAPAPVFTPAVEKQVMESIILPTVAAMQKEGAPFTGVLFAGLMLTRSGPKLLEYNVRFGDPETQVLMRRLDSDLYEILAACAAGDLSKVEVRAKKEAALCVVMAVKGYPGNYEKGSRIGGLSEAARVSGVQVFHAGTAQKDGAIIATGGRVLGVTAVADSVAEAQKTAYRAVDAIDWPEGFCRRDIGWRAVKAA